MKSDTVRLVHIGVNTDPFETQAIDDLNTKKSQSKLTVRDDIQHVHVCHSSILHESYSFEELLGQGSFGKVLAITEKTNSKTWAMKIIPKTLVPTKMNAIQREIHILKIVRHPHIIYLHKILESTNRIYLILEKCSGELGKLFRKSKPFTEGDTKIVITQLAGVVDYLHKNDIVHRDLKLENVLLAPNPENSDDDLFIKVTDFGLGIIKGAYHEMLHDRCGTLTYLSPEIITKCSYSQQCDVWAMGVIMYLLLYGKYPFYAPVEQKLIKLICDYDPDYSHVSASDAAIHLISKMLTKDPALRITAAEVMRHAWIVGSPLSECKHENVLEMMKMWRSDMMLPQGTDCDWVSTKLAGTPNTVTDADGSNHSLAQLSKNIRKQSLKLPIHNIEFDRNQKGKQERRESSQRDKDAAKKILTTEKKQNVSGNKMERIQTKNKRTKRPSNASQM